MKIQIYISLIFILTLVSCNDFLEEYPKDGLVLEQYWQNKEDLYRVLNGAYGSLAQMDVTLFLNGEIRADMLAQGSAIDKYGKGVKLVMDADILATNAFCQWSDFYKVINYCNYVIKYAPIIKEKDNTFSDYYYKASIAEATALRSLMYFYLVRIYKDVPYVTWATENDAVDLFPAKTSGDSILNFILNDLMTIQEDNALLVDQIPEFYGSTTSTKGRMNRYAAYAMIADIALWKFDYSLALEYIEKIENSGQFILVPNKDWYKQFSLGNQFESIFELQMSTSGGNPNGLFNLTSNITNQYFIASNYAENIFVYGDLEKTRKEGTLLSDGSSYRIYKYLGYLSSSRSSVGYFRSSTEEGDANFIIYRYADIMLMKAEALIQKDAPDFAAALELINTLRLRANVPRYELNEFGQSKLTAEEYILEERALELAYEGKRWFDLLRYARRDNYARKGQFINLVVANISPAQRLIVASKLKNTNGWYLPVYQNEIDNNPNLVQNSFYVTPDL
jgi:starch-binding outer membrane protein, SusD/RagB family